EALMRLPASAVFGLCCALFCVLFFFFIDTPTTEIYTLSLHDALPISSSLASGVVLDAKLDRSRGPVATVLVQRGTLRIGDPFIAGAVHGKVRAMFDDLGHRVRESGPSIPVEVLGLEGVPEAGNPFQVPADE